MFKIHTILFTVLALFSIKSMAQSNVQLIISKSQFAGGNNISCNGAQDGKLFVAASGVDRINLTLLKEGVQVSSVQEAELPFQFTGLESGTYSIRAFNSDTLIVLDSLQLFQPSAIQFQVSTIRPVSCQPGNDGQVNFTIQGGTEPFEVFWSGQPQLQLSVSGLDAGSFPVTILDANACQFNTSIDVPNASLPSFHLSTNPPNTFGYHMNCANDNSAWVRLVQNNPSGTEQISWRWTEKRISFNVDPITGLDTLVNQQTFYFSNTEELIHVGAGLYVVSVQNQYGCKQTDSVEIKSPLPFSAIREVTCNPEYNEGCQCPMLFLQFKNLIGGVQPFMLNGVQTSDAEVHSLLAGSNYSYTLVDNAGCQVVLPFQLMANEDLRQEVCPRNQAGFSKLKIGMVQKSQFAGYNTTNENAEDGSIEFNGVGGSGSIQYQLKNLAGTINREQGNGKFTDLSAGNYIIVAKDSLNGEIDSALIELKAPDGLSVQINPQFFNSCESNNGLMTAYVTGGTPGYKYKWTVTGLDGQQTELEGDLVKIIGEGNYRLEVWDANNQHVETNYNLPQWMPFTTNAAVKEMGNGYHTRCDENDGQVIVKFLGGFSPFRMEIIHKNGQGTLINNSEVSGTDSIVLGGFGPGDYVVYSLDATNCKSECSFTVKSPESTKFKVDLMNYPNGFHFSCATCSDAQATVSSVAGGNNQFDWYQDNSDHMLSLIKIEGASSVNFLKDLNDIDLAQLSNFASGTNVNLPLPGQKYLVVSKNESGCLSAACIQLEAPKQASSGWSLEGNQNLDTTHFIGTSDNTPLQLKSNNILGLMVNSNGKVEAPVAFKSARVEAPELGSFSAQDVAIKANGVDAIYLKSNANIGIGTNLPQAKLEVYGNSLLNGEAKIMGNLILPNIPSASVDPYSNMEVLGLGVNGMVSKLPWNITKDACYVTPDEGTGPGPQIGIMPLWEDDINKIYTLCGNVGVGTDNPTSKLHVNGRGLFESDLTAKIFNGTRAFLQSQNLPQNESILSLESGSTNVKLFPNLVGAGYNFMTKPGDIGLIWTNGNGGSPNTGLVIAPNAQATSGLRIDNAGRVTISTTTTLPSGFMLGVGGSIICEELDVRLQGDWGDFVFDKNYKRLSFNDLKAYFEKNKHMPGYPCAQNIAEKGHFGIGENIQSLTVKTEEVFLYLLELNDRLDKLENENKKLKNQITQTTKSAKNEKDAN
jgi:hypothetical protein